jgi:hypothetical protein
MPSLRWPTLLSIAMALAAFVAGLRAALIWKRASEVPIDPGWEDEIMAPAETSNRHSGWIFGMLKASVDSARLNRKAAIWTAWAVVLSVVSALIGAFGNCL